MSGLAPESNHSQPINFEHILQTLPFAYENTKIAGSIRANLADFKVNEILSFELSGTGEHLFLQIEKRGCNTDWVAEQLQRHFNLRSQDVGYAGKKDRHSVSRQWFSLHLPGKTVEAGSVSNDSFQVIQQTRHNKKLRKGSILENQFEIIVSNVQQELDQKLVLKIASGGVPNYFGYQRFGHNANNLLKVRQMFNKQLKVKSRNKRGLYLSAARSFLFNLALAARVRNSSWNTVIAGDCVNLNNTHSFFVSEQADVQTQQRVDCADLHISGWMAGRQMSQTIGEAAQFEESVLAPYLSWIQGLKEAGLDSARRSLRVIPQNFTAVRLDANTLVLKFGLISGSFATSVMRELFELKDLALAENLDD